MSDKQTFTITVTMEDRWIPQFLGMLDFMVWTGQVGASRKVSFYADGDGDFHPKFDWDTAILPVGPISGESEEPFWDAG